MWRSLHRSWRWRVIAAVAVVALLVPFSTLAVARPAAAVGDQPQITTDPALYPAFDPSVPDYVIRCADAPIHVNVSAPDGTTVAVDRQPPASGSFTVDVRRDTGQEFPFTVATPSGSATYFAR